MRRYLFVAVISFLVAGALAAQPTYSMTPSRGPVAGGTEVTVKGEFGDWPYTLFFGGTSVPATRVDGTTLVATTPAHLPGKVLITIFEYDIRLGTGLEFRFEGDPSEAFERLLLPVYLPPISGAFGSEFVTEFQARLVQGHRAEIHGLRYPCIVTCIQGGDDPYVLDSSSPEAGSDNVEPTGTPGSFLFVPKDQLGRVAMSLRVFDRSRSAENFGTEIPIVRARDFATGDQPIALLGVPSDPRFRNKLRIYSHGDYSVVRVTIEAGGVAMATHTLGLSGGSGNFQPNYLEFSDFPSGVGPMTVTVGIETPPIGTPIPPSDRWAFITVTNNETQHITTITPHP